eukprot:7381869-Prymnesium_polylepis.1
MRGGMVGVSRGPMRAHGRSPQCPKCQVRADCGWGCPVPSPLPQEGRERQDAQRGREPARWAVRMVACAVRTDRSQLRLVLAQHRLHPPALHHLREGVLLELKFIVHVRLQVTLDQRAQRPSRRLRALGIRAAHRRNSYNRVHKVRLRHVAHDGALAPLRLVLVNLGTL